MGWSHTAWSFVLVCVCGCAIPQRRVVSDGATDGARDVGPRTPLDSRAPPVCVSGEQRGCVCVGGATGAQICASDGSGLGPCLCPDGAVADNPPGTDVPMAMDSPPVSDVFVDVPLPDVPETATALDAVRDSGGTDVGDDAFASEVMGTDTAPDTLRNDGEAGSPDIGVDVISEITLADASTDGAPADSFRDVIADVLCPAGLGNCDGNPANGCETDLLRTPAHCGACGVRGREQCDGRDNNCDGHTDEGCPRNLAHLNVTDETSPTFGARPGTPFDDICPGGFVRGLHGRVGSAFDQFGVYCGVPRLVIESSSMPYRYTIAVDAGVMLLGHGGTGGSPFSFTCPTDAVIYQIAGRVSAVVWDLRCDCSRIDVAGDPEVGFRLVRTPAGGHTGWGGPGDGVTPTPFSYACATPGLIRGISTTIPDSMSSIRVACTVPLLE